MQRFKGYRILIIDDQNLIPPLIPDALKNQYTFETILNGQKGLNIIQHEEIHLVLINLMLSKLDSLSLCQKIKSLDLDLAPSVLFMTNTQASPSLRDACFKSGVDDVVFSPLTEWQVTETIIKYAKSKSIQYQG